jgi:hypothetical protein
MSTHFRSSAWDSNSILNNKIKTKIYPKVILFEEQKLLKKIPRNYSRVDLWFLKLDIWISCKWTCDIINLKKLLWCIGGFSVITKSAEIFDGDFHRFCHNFSLWKLTANCLDINWIEKVENFLEFFCNLKNMGFIKDTPLTRS